MNRGLDCKKHNGCRQWSRTHDDVIKWKHFPRYWPFVPVTGEFPSQRPVTRSFDVFFDLRLNKRWVNNRDAGDLRRHCAHYDVIVMSLHGSTPPSDDSKHRLMYIFKNKSSYIVCKMLTIFSTFALKEIPICRWVWAKSNCVAMAALKWL